MKTTKISPANIIGGLLFAIMTVLSLYNIARFHSANLWSILEIAACTLISITLFVRMKNPLPAAGFVILAIIQIYYMYFNFRSGYAYTVWTRYRGHYTESFNLLTMIPDLLILGTYIFAAIITIMVYTGDENKRNRVKRLWFVPAVLYAASWLFGIILRLVFNGQWYGGYYLFELYSLVITILYVVSILFALLGIAYPDGMFQQTITRSDGTVIAVVVPEEEGYCGLAKHVLLLLFTFGIWELIWICKTTAYLNRVEDEEPRNPTTKLLLCIFVPFYYIYWVYKSAQRIDTLAKGKEIQSDLSTICLVLAIFIGFIPPILMQDKMNQIATTKVSTATKQSSAQSRPETVLTQNEVVEALKQFKELLDSGVITQEEFDAKKRQLFGL